MQTDSVALKRLNDYQKPHFLIEKTQLSFILKQDKTQVDSRLLFKRNSQDTKQALVLDGCDLTILGLKIDAKTLLKEDYQYDGNTLIINNVADEFVFESSIVINPAANTRFEGLYVSSGNFCTQCEAEGFRRITFYLDRPDVMSVFTTTITANKADYPVMLSNGHRTQYSATEESHTAVWEDPFRKPAYLFALVCGQLACVKGTFTTCSGRQIGLEIYTEEHNKKHCDHALVSLQKAMRWDEDSFALEYDLDLYMIVAVDDFNMGAMENKGLNIFNTKYVLASQQTASDQDYLGIEGVIGHEYFHNWTGNRVTCRDWFQLSLKEGLTVFRDQEFSSDLNSRGIQRIADVSALRTHQFAEDAGPMAHPVRPAQYQQINNFYTSTVYNKGAEVVRMYQTIINDKTFKKGIDLYFERFDGQAVTTDDFRQVMQDASGLNLDQFQLWYEQSGTPIVAMSRQYDAAKQQLNMTFKQLPGMTKEHTNQAFFIPIRFALFSAQGNPLKLDQEQLETTLMLTQLEQTFAFKNIPERAIPSAFRAFSAPIKLSNDLSPQEKLTLMAYDSDAFNRWDAAQQIACDIMLQLIGSGRSGLIEQYTHALEMSLKDNQLDPALCAELLQLPSAKYIAELVDEIDPHAIYDAREKLKLKIADSLRASFIARYQATQNKTQTFELTPQAMGLRALNNACLSYIAVIPSHETSLICADHYWHADNMTDRMGVLGALKNSSSDLKKQLYDDFYKRFEHDNLVLDKWFSLQAVAVTKQGLNALKHLIEHPAFTLKNPNRARSLIGAFAHSGSVIFHQLDGAAYALIADQLLQLDALNPQLAARLAASLIHWNKMVEPLRSKMKACIKTVLSAEGLSADVREILASSM